MAYTEIRPMHNLTNHTLQKKNLKRTVLYYKKLHWVPDIDNTFVLDCLNNLFPHSQYYLIEQL